MLNLTVTMASTLRLFTVSCLIWLVCAAAVTNQVWNISISSPKSGDAVRGLVSVSGTTNLEGFASSEVDFAYHQNDAREWFLIDQSNQPVSDGAIATWDTSTITDGIYDLRLIVNLADGSQKTVEVTNIRVRNYTEIETATPEPIKTPGQSNSSLYTPTPGVLPTTTATLFRPSSTPFPTNPVVLTENDVIASLGKGGLIISGFFLLAGLYAGLKSKIRR
jgi:hypothetical protein